MIGLQIKCRLIRSASPMLWRPAGWLYIFRWPALWNLCDWISKIEVALQEFMC